VVVTLVILALALAVVGPAVGRSTEALRVRGEVARFSAVFRHARERAVTTREPHVVRLEPADHRLTIQRGESESRESRPLPEDLTVSATPPEARSVRFEPHGVSTGGDFRLRSGTIQFRVTVDPLTGRVRASRE
jgi:Tfp pilus assembly protein FimT